MVNKFRHITCLIAVSLIWVATSQGGEHLQILEEEQKLVLTGEISKALGTYDEHLKGAVEYLLLWTWEAKNTKVSLSSIAPRRKNLRRNAQTRCREGHPAYV